MIHWLKMGKGAKREYVIAALLKGETYTTIAELHGVEHRSLSLYCTRYKVDMEIWPKLDNDERVRYIQANRPYLCTTSGAPTRYAKQLGVDSIVFRGWLRENGLLIPASNQKARQTVIKHRSNYNNTYLNMTPRVKDRPLPIVYPSRG